MIMPYIAALILGTGVVLVVLAYIVYSPVDLNPDHFLRSRYVYCPVHKTEATLHLSRRGMNSGSLVSSGVEKCSLLLPSESCEAACLEPSKAIQKIAGPWQPGAAIPPDFASKSNLFMDVLD